MNLLEKSDDEIIAIANPIWDNLVKTSNMNLKIMSKYEIKNLNVQNMIRIVKI